MSRKKVDIWDHDESAYWNENVEWIPGRAGHLETRIKRLRNENLERVEYDETVYWDKGIEIISIQSLQNFLETRAAYMLTEICKTIKVRFSVPRWEPRHDWQARR